MGDFRQDGGKRFGGGHGGGFGGRDRGPVTMHQAVCDKCGKPCEVPFRPTDGKPVYCTVCFGAKKNAGNDRGGDRFPQKNFGNFNPSNRNESANNVSKGSCDDSRKQLIILNEKMDRLIRAVESLRGPKPVLAEEKTKKAVKAVPVAMAKKATKKISKKKKK